MVHSDFSVPVFNCIVYVAAHPDGGVQARVANLAGLECVRPTEREALQHLVTAFKQRVEELSKGEDPIPWIEPPDASREDEQQRLIPVHL